jgi:hypothetical protein
VPVDRGDLALLTLLDLSAAFDTVDHATLLRRFGESYGVGDVVHGWYTSIPRRPHEVYSLWRQTFNPEDCDVWVPEGSVLGPILFLPYTWLIFCGLSSVTMMHSLWLLSSWCYGIAAEPYVRLYRRCRTVDAFEPQSHAHLNTVVRPCGVRLLVKSTRFCHAVPLMVDHNAVMILVRSVVSTSTAACRCGHTQLGRPCPNASVFGGPSACRGPTVAV